ncbi:MAG: hypothetical protein RMI91_04270 [Gemmatales bacterium]|nr:hypothetical protein [Gemmatales bacterium]MDW7993850.1 hypothetical protein [Gemmatales bacterium]
MRSHQAIALVCGVLLIAGLAAQDKKPVVTERPCLFYIFVPAMAHLEIEGYVTRSRGEIRFFESPPVPTGKTYSYTVRAIYGGIVVTRTLEVSPDAIAQLDLRPDFGIKVPAPTEPPTKPKPKEPEKTKAKPVELKPPVKKPDEKKDKPTSPPSFTMTGLRDVLLPLNGAATVRLGVKRTNFDGVIYLDFKGLPKGVTANQNTIPAGADALDVTFRADQDAPVGKYLVTVRAHAAQLEQVAKMTMVVVEELRAKPLIQAQPQTPAAPPPKQETPKAPAPSQPSKAPGQPSKTEAKPRPASTSSGELIHPLGYLKVSGPDLVTLSPGETTKLLLHVTRQHISGPIRLHWSAIPSSVVAPAATLAENEEQVVLTLTAQSDAAPIDYLAKLVVSAAGGAIRLEKPIRIEIR